MRSAACHASSARTIQERGRCRAREDNLLGDGVHRRAHVRRQDQRHDGGVDDAQAADAVHPQIRPDDATVLALHHRAGRAQMRVRRLHLLPQRRPKLVVRRDVGARCELGRTQFRHGARRHQLAVLADRRHQDLDVDRVREGAPVDERRRERVGAVDAHPASAERLERRDGNLRAAVVRRLLDRRRRGAVEPEHEFSLSGVSSEDRPVGGGGVVRHQRLRLAKVDDRLIPSRDIAQGKKGNGVSAVLRGRVSALPAGVVERKLFGCVRLIGEQQSRIGKEIRFDLERCLRQRGGRPLTLEICAATTATHLHSWRTAWADLGSSLPRQGGLPPS